MKLIKLTAFPLVIFASVLLLNSCERDAEQKKNTDFSKINIPLTGANEMPISTSPAIGKLDISYSKDTRTLSYTLSWSGLSGAVTAIHINGPAPLGYASPNTMQVLTISGTVITKCPASATTSCGSLTGNMFVDGVVVKEADLLNGQYYIHIHTAGFPGGGLTTDPRGEIRAQIAFQ
jgi:hypothetical protein